MTAQAAYQRKPFTPEERASFLSWRFGGTLDWCSQILVEIKYPVEDLRWFVDAVQGICKGKEMRIAHSTLAKRAQRFKNKPQARELAKRAIERDREWSRDRQCMIFDIERPKPGEMEGKDKRARTKYTDYLTPTAVWAQETEHKIKKADEIKWKRDAKYRLGKRREILAEALKMLPMFTNSEDMPDSTKVKDSPPLSLSEYVAQREKILLAENKRILDRLCDGKLTSVDEIDERLATLEVFHEKATHELDKSYQSTRDVLLGLRKTRMVRAMDFSDPEEAVTETDEILAARSPEKGNADVPPTWLDSALEEFEQQKGNAGIPLSSTNLSGNNSIKGNAGIPLSVVPEKGNVHIPPTASTVADNSDSEIEEFIFDEADSPPPEAEPLWTMEAAALSLAEDFLVFPCYEPTADGICTCNKGAACQSPGKHPLFVNWNNPESENCATRDPAKIRAWWRKRPNSNIGIATGAFGGVVVLDADFLKGGDTGLANLLDRLGLDALPPTMEVKSGGGAHYYYKYAADDIRNSSGKIAEAVDVRGKGGLVIAPPSLHYSGRRYMLVNGLKPASLPECLREEMLKASKKEEKPVANSTAVPRGGTFVSSGAKVFHKGERNDGLRDVSYGRWLNGWAVDESDLVAQMLEVNAKRCVPPLPETVAIELAQRTARNFARGERQQGGAS